MKTTIRDFLNHLDGAGVFRSGNDAEVNAGLSDLGVTLDSEITTPSDTKEIATDKVYLFYECPSCHDTARQCVDDIVLTGTAVCTDCDVDMDIHHVEIE